MDGQQAAPLVPTDTRAAFFSTMSGLQAEFTAAAVDIKTREAVLKAALADILHVLQDGIGKPSLAPSHALARFMTDFNVDLANIVQDWLGRIEKHDRKTAFRNGFTNSLVVFVLGKVKAGKSSLGNYMAYGCSNPERTPITGTRPHFFTAAMAQGAENQAEAAVEQSAFFRVGARETTKSIQGFRIPGLTWVDSPGLHSVTPENGALASDYADVADLIVYPMHTGNPGRTGDVAEILRLRHAKTRFLVVITQCDRPDEDEAPDGTIVQNWIMKDRATRQGQIEYVRRAVSVAGDAVPFDMLSLSVRYAETHDNNPAAIEESGVADFFRLLTDIARSEGVRRKRETPSRNLDNFVDLVLGADACSNTLSVACVLARLSDLKTKLTATATELDRCADGAAAAILRRIGPVVADQIERHAGDKNQAGFERECMDALRQIVAEETLKAILLIFTATAGALVPVIDIVEISEFLKFKSFTVKIPKSNRKTIGAVGKAGGGLAGAWAGAELGAAAGMVFPGLGNAIGLAVGGALGALLGSTVGNAIGEALGSDWEETMQSGDNRAQVEASAVKTLQDAGQAAVEGFFATLKSAAIRPVDQCATRLRRSLEQFSKVLETEVHSNGQSVPTGV
jgi:predicted GTPase